MYTCSVEIIAVSYNKVCEYILLYKTYPVPDVVWLNNDGSKVDKKRIIPGSGMATVKGSISSMSVSMIVKRANSGVYTCHANNLNWTVHHLYLKTKGLSDGRDLSGGIHYIKYLITFN